MKSTSLSVVVLLALAVAGCNSGGGTVAAPETLEERASYAIGYGAGEGIGSQAADIDLDQLVAGLRAAFAGEDGHMTPEDMQATMMEFQQSMMAAEEERTASEGAENEAAGAAFCTANAAKPGVVVTDSGLQYEVLQEGSGASPTATDEVTVHYHGTLIDGTVFDSSVDRNAPATFPLNRVIPGWTEGVQLMSVGSKFRFVIPGDLAYGAQGPPDIGPNSTLIFEVELLSINGQS